MLDGLSHRLRIHHLAVADRPDREGHLAEALERRWTPTEGELGRSDTGRADVETDRSSSCHWFVLPYRTQPIARVRLDCLSRDEIGQDSPVLEQIGHSELRQSD
jgi:hypothetical protein